MIDVYDGQAFLVVGYYLTHSGNHETGPVFYDLYISDVYGARFQLSLPNIGFISSTFDTEQLRELIYILYTNIMVFSRRILVENVPDYYSG